MEINKSLSYIQILDILKEFKEQYKEKVRSFSYYELHDKVLFIKKTRDSIYSLDLKEILKDKIWEYINDYEFLYVLKRLR